MQRFADFARKVFGNKDLFVTYYGIRSYLLVCAHVPGEFVHQLGLDAVCCRRFVKERIELEHFLCAISIFRLLAAKSSSFLWEKSVRYIGHPS
jgi:hypothetical protein